ncbi:RnfABCDGE type electron transport complex subunit D [Halomonas sp. CUBES01]|uniref:Ion-translocating oxidoreductase complex subunit D n=1 Tax=Vreelandella gomseomensis TaxID=370766 RepID=A0ABU1GD28_9GAMM|nr:MULTISPECIES: RnfABCDGE type electron transport complex subunit D [Halomonas]MDR5874954.1 RnfABCDGE type electron transport complex subunit D [Halomonas gomseomensis]MEC4767240.1 RnfABCDGE type electron transport complex subunit D [Halomonas sp. CUBES01]
MLHASHNDRRLLRPAPSTGSIMRWVIVATLPGLATMTFFFGLGVVSNVLLAAAFGLGFEALILRLRKRSLHPLNDSSALLTGVLLGASLPPASPWWLIGVGMLAAIVVAKQLYGGLGHNPFNPAMVGYALLLVSFPTYMTLWSPPQPLWPEGLWGQITGSASLAQIDGLSGATPLDAFKHKGAGVSAGDFWAGQPLPEGTLNAWRWVAVAWLAGGVLLLAKRLISWHIPVAMLGSMMVMATLLHGFEADRFASPWLHLFTGATLFGAFFIATDPVSAATSQRGKLIYAAGIGVLIMVIRTWGGYPDAVAFAVLLMNLGVPLLDLYTAPRPAGRPPAPAKERS